jgi:hypothetical protein
MDTRPPLTNRRAALRDTRQWLEAEREGREGLAELTFARLMSELPPVEPSPVFVGAIVHRVARRQAQGRVVGWLARVAAVILIAAGSVVVMYVLGAFAVGAIARGSSLLSEGLLWLMRSTGDGIQWWSVAARVGTAIGQSLMTPRTVAAIVAIELLGIYALQRILSTEHGERDSQQVHI